MLVVVAVPAVSRSRLVKLLFVWEGSRLQIIAFSPAVKRSLREGGDGEVGIRFWNSNSILQGRNPIPTSEYYSRFRNNIPTLRNTILTLRILFSPLEHDSLSFSEHYSARQNSILTGI